MCNFTKITNEILIFINNYSIYVCAISSSIALYLFSIFFILEFLNSKIAKFLSIFIEFCNIECLKDLILATCWDIFLAKSAEDVGGCLLDSIFGIAFVELLLSWFFVSLIDGCCCDGVCIVGVGSGSIGGGGGDDGGNIGEGGGGGVSGDLLLYLLGSEIVGILPSWA